MLAPRKKLHSTPIACVEEGLRLMKVGADDVLFDVGCGDGRVLVAAAGTHGCSCVGVDMNPDRITEARAAVEANGLQERVKVVHGNALELDFSPATCVFMFLVKRGLRVMHKQLNALMEARRKDDASCPALRAVSYLYRIPDAKPEKIVWVSLPDKGAKYPMYLYSFPLAHASTSTATTATPAASTASGVGVGVGAGAGVGVGAGADASAGSSPPPTASSPTSATPTTTAKAEATQCDSVTN